VLAIIDTGESTKWQDGGEEARALIVREDPLRPAHHMLADFSSGKLTGSDKERADAAIELVQKALPIPKGEHSQDPVKFADMQLREYIRRIAEQCAATYTKKLFHGAINTSNFDIRGEFIDYGTSTAQPGYYPIKILKHKESFGETGEIFYELVESFLRELRVSKNNSFISKAASNINNSSALTIFNDFYEIAIHTEHLKLTGAPEVLLKQINTNPKVKVLADALYAYTLTEGSLSKSVNIDKGIPSDLRPSELGNILKILVEASFSEHNQTKINQQFYEEAVQKGLKKSPISKILAEAYHSFFLLLLDTAKTDGISREALRTFMLEAIPRLNAPMTAAYRSDMREKNIELINRYKSGGSRDEIWGDIDRRIAVSRRTFRDAAPDELVLSEKINPIKGEIEREVFVLRENRREKRRITIALLQEEKRVPIPTKEIEKPKLEKSNPNFIRCLKGFLNQDLGP
jgi:hypothetical protein